MSKTFNIAKAPAEQQHAVNAANELILANGALYTTWHVGPYGEAHTETTDSLGRRVYVTIGLNGALRMREGFTGPLV